MKSRPLFAVRVSRLVFWVLLVIGGFYLWAGSINDWAVALGLRHPGKTAATMAAVAIAGAAYWYGYLDQQASPWLIGAGLAWALFALGVYNGYEGRDGGSYIGDYCAYGSVSQAQRNRCIESVSEQDVDEARTEAGRFARGETEECGAESGPYCSKVASERTDAFFDDLRSP